MLIKAKERKTVVLLEGVASQEMGSGPPLHDSRERVAAFLSCGRYDDLQPIVVISSRVYCLFDRKRYINRHGEKEKGGK